VQLKGDTRGSTFLLDRVRPLARRIRGKGDEPIRNVLQQVLSAAYPATGEVQATTTSALTSAETVPAVAASALRIRDTDGSFCSAFARALLGRCSVNPRPVARTGFGTAGRHAETALCRLGSPLSWPSVSDVGRNLPQRKTRRDRELSGVPG
jgi:hypothetical protein